MKEKIEELIKKHELEIKSLTNALKATGSDINFIQGLIGLHIRVVKELKEVINVK